MTEQNNKHDLGWNHAVNRPKTVGEARADAVVAAIKLALLAIFVFSLILAAIL